MSQCQVSFVFFSAMCMFIQNLPLDGEKRLYNQEDLGNLGAFNPGFSWLRRESLYF